MELIMLDILLWVAVGAFVGWNFPQPFWAKMMQEKIQPIWVMVSLLFPKLITYAYYNTRYI